MTREELLTWVRQTLENYGRLEEALALLNTTHGMSFGAIARETGQVKGTVHRKAKRASASATSAPTAATSS